MIKYKIVLKNELFKEPTIFDMVICFCLIIYIIFTIIFDIYNHKLTGFNWAIISLISSLWLMI